MRLIIVLAVIGLAYGDKLDKTYLPPSHAQSSGGSNFLQAPSSSPQFRGANSQNFGRNNNYGRNDGFAQNGNGFAQAGNGFVQNGNRFAQNGNVLAQNDNGFAQNGNGEYNVNFENRPERPQAALERNAAILRQDNSNDGETYSYAYETENGIVAEENGVATDGVEAQGGYSYTGDDGQVYSVRYTAGQNGFVPEGDHLPTPHPIPEEILKALEQNARDEAAGIYDDGSYKEPSYANAEEYNSNTFSGIPEQNSQRDFGSDDAVVVNSALLRSNSRNQGNNARYQANVASVGNTGANGDANLFGNTASSVSGRSGSVVNKQYLPPVNQRNSIAFGSRNRQPTFNARDGYRF